MLFDFLSELYDMVTSETKNPSIFQSGELNRHRADIQRLCGEHGLLEAVKGQPHTFECNGIRFKIEDDQVKSIR
jgi:hypothetical protein